MNIFKIKEIMKTKFNKSQKKVAKVLQGLNENKSEVIPITTQYENAQNITSNEVIQVSKADVLMTKIETFVFEMSGKSRMDLKKAKYMLDLYNEQFKTHEADYKCDLCAIRIFKALKKLVDNKKANEAKKK